MTGAEQVLALVGSAAGSAAIVHGIYTATRSRRLSEIESRRAEAAATVKEAARAAAELELRKAEAKSEDRSATAELIRNLTTAYESHASTLAQHMASLENRVRDLESIVNDRDAAIAHRDNVIRRLREHVHTANGELLKAGLREYIQHPADVIAAAGTDPDTVAPERRTPSKPTDPPMGPAA